MNIESSLIKIVNKGTLIKPKYYYISSGEEVIMATHQMYSKFNVNFSDPSIASLFFSKKDGIDLLTVMLTGLKCPLYIESEAEDPNYIESIKMTFNIIQRFTSNLSNIGKTRETHKKYVDMIKKIQEKANSPALKETIIQSSLLNVCSSLSSAQRSIVRDVAHITQVQGSLESARTSLINTSIIDRISKLFLSPIDPSVFDLVREYCIKYIGENKKISDESGYDLGIMKGNLLLTIGLFKRNLKFNNKSITSFNANNIGDINTMTAIFLSQPENARLFIKIMTKMTRFYTDIDDDIELLNEVFSLDSSNSISFDFTPRESYIIGTKDDPVPTSYIMGTKDHPTTIRRITTITETIEKVEITSLKTAQGPKGFFIDDSNSDSDSGDDEMVISTKAISKINIYSSERSVKKKSMTINKVISEDDVFIPIKVMKSIIRLMNEGLNALSSQENKKKATEIIKSIEDGTFGDVKTELQLDWWQTLFLEKVKNGESFVLVGDTSGGKTFISLMAMRILFNQYINESRARFIYMAPTPQLAVLQFSNILSSYPTYSHFFGICCKSIVNIPSTARILIGTPNEIKKYLTNVTYHRETVINLDNIKTKMGDSIKNPFVENCRTLFIDEIQTWSPTYVQDVEFEQIMECKAIEEVISCVNYDKDDKSQVIGMSATLSHKSIENIKRRIAELTYIPEISDILYKHEDIGLSDLSLKKTYKPIMKKPEVIAVKIEGSSFNSFIDPLNEENLTTEDGEIIHEQILDNQAVEMIIRNAEFKKVIPIAFFRESELATIQMFKDFIDHLERKNLECRIWHTLYNRYDDDINSIGYNKMKEQNQIDKWIEILSENIKSVISDINVQPIVDISKFEPFETLLKQNFGRLGSINYSPELYGLIVEYSALKNGKIPFNHKIHPFYRFGTVANANNFFSLEDPSNKDDTTLKKILIAQDADPSSNTGSIIPLIMRGIEYGCAILTSSIPLGYQLEIYKFINIKSKSEANPIPILFCEYGMSMGMNTSIMSVCMCRHILVPIGASEFKQIGGRPGRRGNENSNAPVIYTFNISNTYLIDSFEVLDFNVDNISSNFFTPSEVYDYLTRIIVKYENNKSQIVEKSDFGIDTIIAGDTFKNLGGPDVLLIRKIQIAKYQIRELFNTIRNLNPTIANTVLRSLFNYFQRAEFYSLNVQVR